ncbi:SAP domain-containing protein [bacterium]|nr:SAP domain-containing protein [bacterium]
MFENIEPLWVLTGILLIHLFFFIGFQYQLLQMLEELAFPSDDPIMTSSLKEPVYEYEEEEAPAEPKPEEESEFDYAEEPPNIDPNHGHDLDHIEEVEKEIALEEAVVEPQMSHITVNRLRRMKKDELIELCNSMELDSDGTKTVLVDRIAKNQ